MGKRTDDKKANDKRKTPTDGVEEKRGATPVLQRNAPRWGTRASDAAVDAAVGGARSLWQGGSLQQAGKDVVQGKSGFRAALKSLAKPARGLIGDITKAHDTAALENRVADRQLAEAVRVRRMEDKSRTLKRGGKTETVMRGVITDPQGNPLPGLVVEGRSAGVVRPALLAVDVTDDKGRYQLVIDNEALGKAKEPLVSVEIGLERDALFHAPEGPFKIATGTATDHDVQLPEAAAERATVALAHRNQLDVDRMHAVNRRGALASVQRQALDSVAGTLDELLKRLAK